MALFSEVRQAILEVEQSRRREENARRLKYAFRTQDLAMAGLEKAVEALSQRIRQHEAWKYAARQEQHAFMKEMKDREYGYEALLNAWCWFHIGWWCRGGNG